MARTRNLKPAFFDNEQLGECDPLARLLFQGLWCYADCDGCLEDRAVRLKKQILPYDDCDVRALLDQLADRGFIERFQSADGRSAIRIVKFRSHQKPHVNEQSLGLTRSGKVRNRSGKTPKCSGDSPKCSDQNQNRSDPYMGSEVLGMGSGVPLDGIPSGGVPSKDGSANAELCRPSVDRADEVRQVFDHYRKHQPKAPPKPASDSPEWRKIRKRLEEGYLVSDLCEAIDGCHKSPFHCGENERHRKYQSLGLIFRDSDHVAMFISIARSPPGAVLSEKTQRTLRAQQNFLNRHKAQNDDSERP